eukprot:scaffold940_cov569-Prasinococcus_capsulatus_cf.AAC.23
MLPRRCGLRVRVWRADGRGPFCGAAAGPGVREAKRGPSVGADAGGGVIRASFVLRAQPEAQPQGGARRAA